MADISQFQIVRICLFLACFSPLTGFSQKKPNVVFILADDLTKWDVGAYGSVDAITPTIDKLASEGIKFNRCFQASPMCSPTRHNLLTGIYPVRTKAYPNHTFAKEGTKSIVHHIKPLGYKVAYSGKRHILPLEVFPFEYLDGDGPTNEYDPDFNKIDLFLENVADKGENFCLFINSTAPHSPWIDGDRNLFDKDKITLPPYLADLEDTRINFRNYLAEINYLDGQVKQTLDLLEKYSLTENTVVFFSTEQGNSMPFAKWTLYNAGVTSGLIVKWPGKIEPGIETNALVEFSDIVPTIIDMVGGSAVEGLDGFSMLSLLLQEKDHHKDFTFSLQTTRGIYSGSQYFPIRSVSDGEYRLILNLTPDVKFSNTVTEKDEYFKNWKNSNNPENVALAYRYENRPSIELYNDLKDPYNLNNLAENRKFHGIIENLKGKLEEWMMYCGDEGLRTEFEATEYTRNKSAPDSVIMYLDFHPATETGNFEVEKDGYYFFYTDVSGEILIDGRPLMFGKREEMTFANFGVIALRKGLHHIQNEEDKKVHWSGSDMNKKLFK
jgi:uncharacterized sulfatase